MKTRVIALVATIAISIAVVLVGATAHPAKAGSDTFCDPCGLSQYESSGGGSWDSWYEGVTSWGSNHAYDLGTIFVCAADCYYDEEYSSGNGNGEAVITCTAAEEVMEEDVCDFNYNYVENSGPESDAFENHYAFSWN